MSVGEKVIDQIIESKLFTVTCPESPDSSCVVVWSANAPEQLSAMISEHGSPLRCYRVRDDDEQPVMKEWIAEQNLQSSMVRVQLLAVNHFYDAIEIWNHPDEDDPNHAGVLAIHKYPILRGDVRRLCFGLGIAER